MFCLYGANVKDVTPRFGSLRKWRHPEYESGVYHVILTYLLVFGVELYQMLSESLI